MVNTQPVIFSQYPSGFFRICGKQLESFSADQFLADSFYGAELLICEAKVRGHSYQAMEAILT